MTALHRTLLTGFAICCLHAPEQVAAQSQPISVTVTEISPGVFHVGSSYYFMLAVRQGDSLVVVDLPDTEVRSRAMLDTLRSRFPRTPVRLVVASHHHGDHIAGLALTFAAGAPVITHAATREHIRAFGLPPGSDLARSRDVRAVRDSLTIGSGANAIHVYAISNAHADAMLVAYLPAHRLLSAPDLAEWGPWELERAALTTHVKQLGLRVDRVAPGHNPVRPWSEFDPDVTRGEAKDVLGRAADAMGGEKALRAIRATQSTVWLTRSAVGGGEWPGAPTAPMHLSGVLTRDYAAGRSAFVGQRMSHDAPAPVRFVATPSGGFQRLFSHLVRYDADSLAARAREQAFAPERMLVTALDGSCRFDTPSAARVSLRSVIVLRCATNGVGPFRLRVDSATARPLEIELQTHSRVYERETAVMTVGGYRRVASPAGPLVLPAVVHTSVNGRLSSTAAYSRTLLLSSVDDSLFAMPERMRLDAPPPTVQTREIAPGVLYLESDSLYYALAVAQDSTVVLFEAAETEDRMRAMLAAVRRRFPEKQVEAVIATHHHADHLAGLPAVFDLGLSVVVHADNAANVQSIRSAGEARRPSPGGSVRGVRDSLVIGAGTARELRLYALALSESATHLIAYLPVQRLLFAADVAEGGRPSADLMEHMRRLSVDVDSVATAHSGLWPWPR